jgi:hypothetical protein
MREAAIRENPEDQRFLRGDKQTQHAILAAARLVLFSVS